MYDTDPEIELEAMEFASEDWTGEDNETFLPANLVARRLIERRMELKRLRELLDDPYLENLE